MAKTAVAVALLSAALLLAGPAVARQLPGVAEGGQGRHLLSGFGQASGDASSSGQDAIALGDQTAFAGQDFGAAGGFTASAALQPNGQVSVDESNSVGDAIALPTGQTQAQTQSGTTGNGVPGSQTSEGVNVGAFNNGFSATGTGSAVGQSGRRL